MLRRALRFTSFLCCAIVLVSFAVFTNDQLADASAHQQSELASGTAVTADTTTAVAHSQPWQFIDTAAGQLTAPFDSIVPSHNAWVNHGLTALFALIVYGMGLGWVARFSSGRVV